MDPTSELFNSVFSRLIESLTPRFQALTSAYDNLMNNPDNNKSLNTLIQTYLTNTQLYQLIIDSMCSLSKNNISQFLKNIIDIYANTLLLQDPGIFSILMAHSNITSPNSSSPQIICNYLALYVTTDITGAIIRKYGVGDQGPFVARIAYKNCDPSVNIDIHEHLLHEWSIILAITSIKHLQESTAPFLACIGAVNNEMLFTLVSKIRLDSCKSIAPRFVEDIFTALKILQKRGELTNKIFSSVASILTSLDFFSDSLQKIFDIAWYEKDQSSVQDGAFELIITLYLHLPNKSAEAIKFFQKRMSEKKTERDLKLFWRLVMGGYNGLTTDDDMSFIGMTGSNAPEMPSLFMNLYFKKANFAICPEIFSKVLLHLASINFSYFIREILQSFLMLNISDIRFIILLSIIEPINSEKFKSFAVSRITKEDIDTLNLMIRGKVYQNLHILTTREPRFVPLIFLEGAWRRIQQADSKISMFLEQNNLDKYVPFTMKYDLSVESEFYSLEAQLLRCLPYVLEKDDFVNSGIMKNILECCNSEKLQTALSALDVAKYLCKTENLQQHFAKEIVNNMANGLTQETLFVCLKLLSLIIQENPNSISSDMYHDIEFYAFIGLISCQPNTRIMSWKLLDRLDELLEHKGLVFYIHTCKQMMEKMFKIRLFGKSVHKDEVLLQCVMDSRYYDLWLLYIAEFIEIILASNYTPLLQRFGDNLYTYLVPADVESRNDSPVLISLYLMYINSKISKENFEKCPSVYRVPLHELRAESQTSQVSPLLFLSKLLDGTKSWKENLAFIVIKYLHISYAGDVADIISQCSPDQITEASTAFLSLLDSPQFSEEIVIFDQVLNLLNAMHSILIKQGATSPRTFTPENEKQVLKSATLAENYCLLINKIATRSISEADWSTPARENVLRSLLNWSMTKHPALESLRVKAKDSLATFSKSGQMFGDAAIFDKNVIEIFGEIECSGNRILNSVLFYHVKLVLTQFCDACLTLSRNYADLFFDALFVVFTAGSNFTPQQIGCLLLVGLVYDEMQHPRASEFMEAFTSSVYEKYMLAAEAVFSEAFRILSLESLHMPVKEISNVLRSLIPEIRLLPKQSSCTVDSPERFQIYTPYQFLVALMKVTESINEDFASHFYLLWRDLLDRTDHEDIVPLFIMQWENPEIKKKLLLFLVKQDAPFVSEKLMTRCSFDYFLHVASQNRSFKEHLWVIELLTKAFEGRIGSIPSIIALLHFAFLFYKIPATQPLLQAICKHFDVAPPTSSHDEDLMVTVNEFVIKLSEDDPESLEYWGTEALKWLFGCNKLKFAALSLKIYNVLGVPIDRNIIQGVIKIVHYYVVTFEDDPLSLTDLLTDAFRFFSNIFPRDELMAFNFASAFIDCSAFPDNCKAESIDIFLKSMNSQATSKQAWSILPSIVRPLLSRIETDERCRQILEILAKTSQSPELMMIAAPIKEAFGGFAFCTPINDLMEKSDETLLCKAIEHYSLMIETASEQLASPIFRIASEIIIKVTNMNVREQYAILYKAALNMIGVVPTAMKYVISLAEHDPEAVMKSTLAFTDWERSYDDVVRALSRIVNPETAIPRSTSIPKLTDNMSLISIIGLIGGDIPPKVIPFVMEKDMIEGMKRVVKVQSKSIKHNSSSSYLRRLDSASTIKYGKFSAGDWELKPLEPPKELLGKIPEEVYENLLIMEYSEFDANYPL